MIRTLASLIKLGLSTTGHYHRALARTTLPGVAVLCYHGIRDDEMAPGTMPFQYLHIPESTFESHCRMIRECCDPISLDDWRAASAGGPPLPQRPVLITLDDGYRSVLTKAAPILRKYDLPAVVFVCSGPMATRRRLWFDEIAERDGEAAVEAWKARDYEVWRASCAETSVLDESDPRMLMTPAELGTLSRIAGIEIGGHTVRHPILAHAAVSRQRQEIEEDLTSIAQWTGKPVRAFAYPNGRPGIDYTAATLAILRECGVDTAFTTRASFADAKESPLERSRFVLLDEANDLKLVHRLTYSWPR